jgi:hypothetical protein
MATSTWNATLADSWRPSSTGGGSGGWRGDSRAYQGQFENFGLHRGCWFFNDANMRSTLSGRTITNITLRLTRLNGGGSSASQDPTIRLHNHSSRPSGSPSLFGQLTYAGGWSWGQTKTIDLPTTWGNALRDGTARGVGIYTTSDSPYMIFTASAVITVTHEPSVAVPATPTGLAASQVTQTSARLTCNAVSGAESYTFEKETFGFATRTSPLYDSAGLTPNTDYRYRVRANNVGGSSSFSSWVTVRTVPPTPTNLRQIGRTHTTITVQCDPLNVLYEFQPEPSIPDVAERVGTIYTHGGRTPGESVRYRVRSKNDSGVSPFTGWITATAQHLPNAPTLAAVEAINRTVTSRFGWTVSHPDAPNTPSGFQIQMRPAGGATSVDVTQETTATYYDLPGSTLAAGTHEWRVRTRDNLGGWGTFSSWDDFLADQPPAGPTLTAPTAGAPVTSDPFSVTWSAAEQEGGYQLQVVDGVTVVYDTGTVEEPDTRTAQVPYPDNNVDRTTRVRVLRNGLWSAWSEVAHPVSYTPPAQPDMLLEEHMVTLPSGREVVAGIRVTPEHPDPFGDQPDVEYINIWRVHLPSGEATRLLFGADPDVQFVDWSVRSTVEYGYIIFAHGSNSTSSMSGMVSEFGEASTPLPTFTLTVDTVGSGEVTGGGGYAEGATAQVAAYPTPGWLFDAWAGDLTGNTNPTTLLMDANKSITAMFIEDPNAGDDTLPTTLPFTLGA